jgi:hypothetical protein
MGEGGHEGLSVPGVAKYKSWERDCNDQQSLGECTRVRMFAILSRSVNSMASCIMHSNWRICHIHRFVIYTNLSYTPICHIHQFVIYTDLSYTPICHIHQFVIYTDLSYTPICHIHQFVIYTNLSYTPICHIHQFVIYTNLKYTPICHIHQSWERSSK